MECRKCGTMLDYSNITTLVCPKCHAIYTVSEEVASKQKSLKEKNNSVENNRPNFNVVSPEEMKNTKFTINEENDERPSFLQEPVITTDQEKEIVNKLKKSTDTTKNTTKVKKEKVSQIKSSSTKEKEKEDKPKKEKTKKEKVKKEDKIKKEKPKKEKVKKEKKNNKSEVVGVKKEKKTYPPFSILLINILQFLPLCLPFIHIIENGSENKNLSMFIFNNFYDISYKDVLGGYYYIAIAGIILTLLILILLLINFVLYAKRKLLALYIMHYVILIISLTIFMSFLITFSSIPSGIGEVYTISFISYTYITPVLSFINLCILRKKNQ